MTLTDKPIVQQVTSLVDGRRKWEAMCRACGTSAIYDSWAEAMRAAELLAWVHAEVNRPKATVDALTEALVALFLVRPGRSNDLNAPRWGR